MSHNQYYNCLTSDGAPIPWDPPDLPAQWVWGESVYFGHVFRHLDDRLGDKGLTVYLTSRTDYLPSYGPKVVAVIVADELYRIPHYVNRVAAVFKNHGVRPRLGCHPLREPSLVNLRSLFVFVGRSVRYLPSAARYLLRRTQTGLTRKPLASLHEIPVGTFNQLELPVPPVEQRRIDVCFGGSINQGRLPGTPRPPWWEDVREFLGPKRAARASMIANLRRAQEQRPDLVFEVLEAPGYLAALDADPMTYSRMLVDAKISLVPRGTSPQTFRLFQSLRAGCIVVTDVLPSHWFSTGAPVVRLKHWNQLTDVIATLLADSESLVRRQRESLAWWHSRCSEEAVAAFMAAQLATLAL